MKSEWITKPVGELTSYMSKGIPPKYSNAENNTTIRVLNQKCNRDFKITYEYSRLHDLSKKSVPKEKLLRAGDVLINSTGAGTAGRVAQLFEVPCLTTIDGHMILLRPTSEIEAYYYGYAIKSFQKQIELLAEGSTGQTEINRKRLSDEIEITFPIDLNLQRQISSIFFAIDEKISTNTKINENLEQQAQAIFKSWFIDFEPFGGVMPDDWKSANLLDIADYLNGLAMQKYRPVNDEVGLPVLKIKELRQGFCDDNSELCSPNIKGDYIVQDGDVIFSWSGSLLVDFWCGGKCGLNQHLFKVSSKSFDKWFYYIWTKYHLNRFIAIAADMATTMGHIKRSELEKSLVLIPNETDYVEIGNLLKPIYETIIINRIENQRLATLRDTLLPKLMNGEIDVSQIKI